jgi:hypothetical protein
MLRAKESMIRDLKAAVLKARRDVRDALVASRVVLQEDLILQVKAQGDLIQLGAYYVPEAVLLEVGGSTDVLIGDVVMSLHARETLHRDFAQTAVEDGDGVAIETCGVYTPSDAVGLERRLTELSEARLLLFDDARADVASVSALLRSAAAFRDRHWDQFKSAYVLHSLIGLLEPLVLAEVVVVDLLREDLSLDQLPWFTDLADFDRAVAALTKDSDDYPKLTKQVHTQYNEF